MHEFAYHWRVLSVLRAYFLAALDGNDLLYVARIAFSNMLLLSWLRQPNDMHPLTLAQAKAFFYVLFGIGDHFSSLFRFISNTWKQNYGKQWTKMMVKKGRF